MDIVDFLPKYPNINKSKYSVLNPYEDGFYNTIYHKKEFYENRLEHVEQFPKERGVLTKHQKNIARYVSEHTPYDKIMLVHGMGTGKTCSVIGAIEQIKNNPNSTFTGAIILAKGTKLLDNFRNELVHRCTAGQYIPANFKKLTDLEKIHRIKKLTSYYQFETFDRFAKKVDKMSELDIIDNLSNKIYIIDESHNLRIQENNKNESIEIYQAFHRFLHLVTNCKVLLLSGTPMKDTPEEIAAISNLLLPLDKQLPTGKKFLEEFMNINGDIYTLIPEKREELKQLLKGKISFLRESSSHLQKEFIGQENVGNLQHFIVDPLTMSKFQTKYYIKALKEDSTGQTGVYLNSRQSSLFVFPDGSYGREGFKKYIKTKKLNKKRRSYKMTDSLKSELQGSTNEETLQNIRKYSITYATVIENILNSNGNCFIYSSYAKGSGGILFGLLLELFNYSKVGGKIGSPALRYAVLTSETCTNKELKNITKVFNRKSNKHGKYIQVIIGSRAVSEGFTFKNVIFEAILTPHWNYSETAQALARGIRLGSHNDLLLDGEKPIVKIIQPVAIPRKRKNKEPVQSVDLLMYETSESKDINIRHILRVLMETSFDCALNYFRNFVDGKDGSRECDYTRCDYKCDGINMELVREGLDDEDLDYSTYQLYYANEQIPLIRRRIEQLFRANHHTDLDSIINNLSDKFTEDEIMNALYLIQEETDGTEFDYKTFLRLYSKTPVKKIISDVEKLFRSYFRLELETIQEHLPEYTEFEILTALRTIINNSIILTNKYGLPSYLKEDKNIYFLVSNLTIESNFFSEYYTKYPNITTKLTFDEIFTKIHTMYLPKLIKQICKFQSQEEFSRLMQLLQPDVQEIFLELTLIAVQQGSVKNKELQEYILSYFQTYIHHDKDMTISSLLKKSANKLRCKHKDNTEWIDCSDNYADFLEHEQVQKMERLKEDNPYGIAGTYNMAKLDKRGEPVFCIADFMKEIESRKNVKRSSASVDKRIKHTGRTCETWKIPDLLKLSILRLKLPVPSDYKKDISKSVLRTEAKKAVKLKNVLTHEEIDNLSTKNLRRALYWGTVKNKKKDLCTGVKNFLDENNLLVADDQCGVTNKKKGGAKKKKGLNLRAQIIIPNEDPSTFTAKAKEIRTLLTKSCGFAQNRLPEDNSVWVLVYVRTIAAVINIDNKNRIRYICVNKSRRKDEPKEIIKFALSKVVDRGTLILRVNKRDKKSATELKRLKRYGFEPIRSDKKYTYLEFSP